MEWSFNIESKFFVKFTLGWFTLPLVNVDNVPLLMDLSILGCLLNVSSFGINSSLNHKVFVLILVEASNVVTFNSEQLPPSGVLCYSSSNVWVSTIGVNFHNVVLPVLIENELGSLIESPLGMYSMSWSPSSMVNPMVSVHCHDSLHWHS
jgi:hypothetical protein